MKTNPNPFEVVLFYTDEPRVRFGDLHRAIAEALADLGVAFEPQPVFGQGCALFSHPDMHLVLTADRVPVDPTRHATASIEGDETREALARHRKALRLSLGDGPHYGKAGATPADPALKLTVLYRLTRVLAGIEQPLAIHWVQSDRIFSPDALPREDNGHFPAALCVNACAQRLPVAGGAGTENALALRGSEVMTTRRLVILPGPLDDEAARSLAQDLMRLEALQPGTLAGGIAIACSRTRWLEVTPRDDVLLVRCVDRPAADDGSAAPRWKTALGTIAARVTRRHAKVYALCALIGLAMPLPGAAIAVWNLVRGPNLIVTALAGFMVALLAAFGLLVGESVETMTLAGGVGLH